MRAVAGAQGWRRTRPVASPAWVVVSAGSAVGDLGAARSSWHCSRIFECCNSLIQDVEIVIHIAIGISFSPVVFVDATLYFDEKCGGVPQQMH